MKTSHIKKEIVDAAIFGAKALRLKAEMQDVTKFTNLLDRINKKIQFSIAKNSTNIFRKTTSTKGCEANQNKGFSKS